MISTRTLLACFVAALFFAAAPAMAQNPDPGDPGYEEWKQGLVDPGLTTVPPGANEVLRTKNIAVSDAPSSESFGGGLLVPYANDGSWVVLPKNDDGSTGLLPLPFTFELYGSTYNNVCVNNNGNISFDGCVSSFSSTGFPSNNFIMVAPFWADVDTCDPGDSCTGEVAYKQTMLDGQTVFVAHWEEVGYFFENESLRNTFQVIIADGATLPGGNNVCFSYGDMNWTTGDASSGTGGLGGIPATVGANRGNGVDFFQYGRFNQDGTAYDGPGGNNDGVDFLDDGQICFNTGGEGTSNVPPVVVSEPDSPIMVAAGDPIDFTIEFIPPEVDQTIASVDVSYTGGIGTSDVACSTTFGPNGGVTEVTCSGSIDAGGMYSVLVEATDTGTPAQSTTSTVNIVVEGMEEPEGCSDDLVISDFSGSSDFFRIRNVGTTTVTLDNCAFVATYQDVYYSTSFSEGFFTLAPGEQTVELSPGNILRDAFSGLALVDRAGVSPGTSIPDIQPDIVASLVYLSGDVVYGFYHRDEASFQAQCADYVPTRYGTLALEQCATPSRGDGSGEDGRVTYTHAEMTDMALEEIGQTVATGTEVLPTASSLSAAYPNPMSQHGVVTVELAEAADVRVEVYDVLGRAVATLMDAPAEAGRYALALDASSLAPGAYLVRLTANGFVQTQRVTVVR